MAVLHAVAKRIQSSKRKMDGIMRERESRSIPLWNERGDQICIIVVIPSLVPPSPAKHVPKDIHNATGWPIRLIVVLHTQLYLGRVKRIQGLGQSFHTA